MTKPRQDKEEKVLSGFQFVKITKIGCLKYVN